ncbi:DUF3575 domain-containing protein [Chitinophaga rhizophila]|uniref:DUF3575 domain-containing protein n=1 Tax=Chitinophaga rhizophila TaxID=2866212 RepID=A0ABS7GEB5_9BACT|nr:DUF3575 domain-containing protein [Chitinophaga rhizophila]MBW8685022.1 DUF3575 domain-containing protein [Chitinophaga rhizophila]
MKQLYAVIFCLCLTAAAFSQGRSAGNSRRAKVAIPAVSFSHKGVDESLLTGWSLSTNLLSLYAADGGISLAAEYRFNKSWSVVVEGCGIFIDSKNFYDLRGRFTPKAQGFYVRPEIRYYLPGKYRRYRWFFGQEIAYKQVAFLEERIERIGGSNPDEGIYDYEKLSVYDKTKRIYSTSGKFGMQTFFDKQHHFLFEFHAGLGVRYKTYSYKAEPPASSYLEDRNYNFDSREDRRYLWDISIPMAVKFGYRF